MIKTTLNWTIKNLKAMNDEKETLCFDHPVQRQSGQWDGDKLKKSLLIHSILANYPVPPIYCLKEPMNDKDYSYSVLDGKQRLTTIFDFIDGKYPLDEETPDVTIDDTVYQIKEKHFDELEVDVQQELLRFKFTIYGFEGADDDLIEEIFYRLNNSSPLTKAQKSMPLCGVSNAKFIKALLEDKFFSSICKFSALQRRKSDDMCTLLQSMMLLSNRHEGYEYSSLSADEVMRYASHIKGNYSEEQKEHLYDIIDYLEKAFPVQDKMLKKINIPMVMLCADLALGENYNATKNIYKVGPRYFRQWFTVFFTEDFTEYSQYCSSGSTKKDRTIKRIEIMEKSFKEYFELEDNMEEEEVKTDVVEDTDIEPVEQDITNQEESVIVEEVISSNDTDELEAEKEFADETAS